MAAKRTCTRIYDVPINGPTCPGGSICACLEYNPQPGFTCTDIAKIVKYWDDGAEETSYSWLLKLDGGRWAVVHGGHDYTGWDGVSSAESSIHETKADAIRFGMTNEIRDQLGFKEPK
jgi:hypothetical protein